MRMLLSVLFSLAAVGAQAHESLAPHHHPHGLSMLPDLGTLAVGGLALAAALLVYFKFRRG